MTENEQKAEWYNTKKLEKYAPDASMYFIVGARRIGKTLHFQKKAFDLWYEKGLQTMWLRNKKVELSDPSFYGDFLNAPKLFGWCSPSCYAKQEGVYDQDNNQIIKFQSISTFGNRRGNMSADVGLMVFDEFMPEDRRYPKRAHIGLLSLTKTILSGREDAKCYCLSNFVSSANPYWVGFGIYPNREKDVTYFRNKGIAIEVCRGYRSAIEQDNKWTRVYKAGGYQDYASEQEDSLFELVVPTPKGGKEHGIYILSGGKTYGATIKDGLLHFHPAKPLTPNVYTASLQETSADVALIPRFYRRDLKLWSEANILRFDSPNTMFAILSIIYDAV